MFGVSPALRHRREACVVKDGRMGLRSLLAAVVVAVGLSPLAASAADMDSMCYTMDNAASAGPVAAEAAAYEIGVMLLGAGPDLIQHGCRSIWCGLSGATPEVSDAILRGLIRSGNDDLAACIAVDTDLTPAAIDGSPN
jgi:hypothetical protein